MIDNQWRYLHPEVDDPYTLADIVGMFITALAFALRLAMGIGGLVMYALYYVYVAAVLVGVPALVLLNWH